MKQGQAKHIGLKLLFHILLRTHSTLSLQTSIPELAAA